MMRKELQDLVYMGNMGLPSFVIDEDVIKKYREKMTFKGFKYMIHETLEGGGCTTKAKRNNQELIMAFISEKEKFGNSNLFHMDLVIA
jgi:hypothetical protein